MKTILTLLIASAALLPLSAHAQSTTDEPFLSSGSTRGPIEITAEQLEVRQEDQTAMFSGNVLAIQGEMNLKADKMTVHYRSGDEKAEGQESVSRIDVDGNVFISNPSETASGAKGIYDVDKNEIRLLGDVTLTRGENVLKGSALIYDMEKGRSVLSRADGSKSSKRVRALFMPKKKAGQ